MIAFLVRFMGLALFAGAFVVFISNGIRSIAADQLVISSLRESWFFFHPDSLMNVEALSRTSPGSFLWEPVLLTVLNWPTALTGGLAGVLLMLLGGRPRRRFAVD